MSKQLTPLKAIRANCLDCSCNQPKQVKFCPITTCTLYFYRLGHNPNRKRRPVFSTGLAPKSSVEASNFTQNEALND